MASRFRPAWSPYPSEGKARRDETTPMFGDEKLPAILEDSGELPAEEIRRRILDGLTDCQCDDDVTMVIAGKPA